MLTCDKKGPPPQFSHVNDEQIRDVYSIVLYKLFHCHTPKNTLLT